jgi:hypothetical protein
MLLQLRIHGRKLKFRASLRLVTQLYELGDRERHRRQARSRARWAHPRAPEKHRARRVAPRFPDAHLINATLQQAADLLRAVSVEDRRLTDTSPLSAVTFSTDVTTPSRELHRAKAPSFSSPAQQTHRTMVRSGKEPAAPDDAATQLSWQECQQMIAKPRWRST